MVGSKPPQLYTLKDNQSYQTRNQGVEWTTLFLLQHKTSVPRVNWSFKYQPSQFVHSKVFLLVISSIVFNSKSRLLQKTSIFHMETKIASKFPKHPSHYSKFTCNLKHVSVIITKKKKKNRTSLKQFNPRKGIPIYCLAMEFSLTLLSLFCYPNRPPQSPSYEASKKF